MISFFNLTQPSNILDKLATSNFKFFISPNTFANPIAFTLNFSVAIVQFSIVFNELQYKNVLTTEFSSLNPK